MKNRRKEKRMMQKDMSKQRKETKVRCEICGREFEKITSTHLKKHNITSDEYMKQFPDAPMVSEDLRKKFSEAKSGKNHPMYGKEAWNKGLTKENDNRVKKCGEELSKTKKEFYATEEGQKWLDKNKRGKHHSEEAKQKMRGSRPNFTGENHPMYGVEPWNKGETKETNEGVRKYGEKQSKTKKEFFRTEEGQKYIEEHLSGENHPMFGKYFFGENNSNYKGGISFLPYCEKFDNDLKERVRDFFNGCCYVCGIGQSELGQKLDVHHVNYNKMVCCNDVKPLFVPLCRSCHAKTLKDREYWEEFFTVSLEYLTDGQCFLPKEQENIFVKNKNRR